MPPDDITQLVEERGETYGKPSENHARTARLWNSYIENRLGHPHMPLTAIDICFLNILQKISRSQSEKGPSHDSLQDIAGYAKNILELLVEEIEAKEDILGDPF